MTAVRRRIHPELYEPDTSRDIVVVVGFQHEGVTYRLHPVSAARIRAAFPNVRAAPSVYVGYTTRAEFESLHGPMWPQIVILLTGLDAQRMTAHFSRLLLWDPITGRQWENLDGTLRAVA